MPVLGILNTIFYRTKVPTWSRTLDIDTINLQDYKVLKKQQLSNLVTYS